MKINNNTLKCVYTKCNCKGKIDLTQYDINEVVRYGKKYYHSECFISWCNDGLNRYKSDSTREKYIARLNNIDEWKSDAKETLCANELDDMIYKFIIDRYAIENVPPYIYNRLANIYNGSEKGLTKGIPRAHILDMWKRKSRYLDKQYERTIVKGYEMSKQQRILYDISILLSKYDSYLVWLNKEKLKEEEIKQSIENNNMDINDYINNISNKNEEQYENDLKSESDFSDLVDDIFGD